jgi:hypothetical protein
MEIQLVRESWGENDKKGDRWVDLYVGADGSARLSRHDLRPSLEESSDDEDYEYHVNVPAAAVPSVKRKALNFGGDAHPVGQSGTWKGDATESLADIRAAKSCPLYPRSGHVRCNQRCRLWAKSAFKIMLVIKLRTRTALGAFAYPCCGRD